MARLGDYVNIKTGKLDANAASANGKYPFFTCAITPLKIDTYSYDCECVLVAGNGDLNVKYYSGKFDAYQRTYIIESKNKNNLSLRYLYYFLEQYIETLRKESIGGVIKYIKLGNLTEAVIPIPPLEEQHRIVSLLDKVSDLIAKRRAQLDKLDLLVKSRFVEMFGDCKTNPKGWGTCCLEDIAEVGSSKRVFVEELKNKGIPFYRGTEVGALAEGLTITPELFITEEHYAELCDLSGKPQKGDLLMPSICPDGRIWLVDTDNPFYFKDGRVLWVHGISDRFDPVFLLYTLKDRIMTDYSSIASGTTFAELKIFALKKCRIFTVPVELQKKFSSFIQSTSKSKMTIQKSLDELETLKKSLMQHYFG